jgi:DNA-binding NtrC family response regulator
LRRIDPNLRALAISDYTVEEATEELRKAGFLDVIQKPFRMDALDRAISRALDPNNS